MGTDCDRLLLDDSPSPLGDDLAPAGLRPSFWVDSNEAPTRSPEPSDHTKETSHVGQVLRGREKVRRTRTRFRP